MNVLMLLIITLGLSIQYKARHCYMNIQSLSSAIKIKIEMKKKGNEITGTKLQTYWHRQYRK